MKSDCISTSDSDGQPALGRIALFKQNVFAFHNSIRRFVKSESTSTNLFRILQLGFKLIGMIGMNKIFVYFHLCTANHYNVKRIMPV